MIALYRQACAQVLRKPLALVVGFVGLLAVAALSWWWLSMPVATTLNLALLALVSVVTPLLALFLVWRAFAVFRQQRAANAWRALGRAPFWAALALALLAGLALPWALIQWVPGVNGLWGQLASMVARWSVAGIVFVASLLWLAAVTRLIAESGDGDDIQPEERQADQTA